MEPSKIFGGNEECHSSESGWTMYIGSPLQGGGDGDGDDGGSEADAYAAGSGRRGRHADETHDHVNHEADDDSDDDSMASDASSGPSYLYGKHDVVEEDEEEGNNICYLDKKAKKPLLQKQKLGMKKKQGKEEKEQIISTFKAKEATTNPSRSGSKVRKSIWLGKRN